MSKVLTFSRVFPAYHPKAGKPTYFVEKILQSMNINIVGIDAFQYFEQLNPHLPESIIDAFVRSLLIGHEHDKHHTIRAGHRFKAGDWFKPAVWGNDVNPKSGRSGPYHSKQIRIAPDIQIPKTWDIKMIKNGYKEFYVNGMLKNGSRICMLAMNDGLTTDDLFWWFNKPFDGQIICWSDQVEY